MARPSNKKIGNRFENMINQVNRLYDVKRYARVTKSNEPVVVTRLIKGQIRAGFYASKSDPDFSGTLSGGQSVVFEAKHTSGTNIPFNQVKEHQERELIKHDHLGAESFLLISFSFKSFYKIDINDWMHLKKEVNKKSLNEKDLAAYKLDRFHGYVDYLGYFDEREN